MDGYVTVECLKAWKDVKRGLAYKAGQTFLATKGHAAFLLRYAPTSFHIEEEPRTKAPKGPTRNKMIREPSEQK